MTALRGHARHRAEADPRGARPGSSRRQPPLPRDEPPATWPHASGSTSFHATGNKVGRMESRGTVARAIADANCRSRVAGARAPRGGCWFRPDARRREHQHHHSDRDEASRQERRRRMQPHRRRGEHDGRPHPVRGKRDKQPRQRQLGTTAPARLLPQPTDHRPALPSGQPGHEVDRDPLRAALRRAVQPGPMVRPRRDVLIPNADHGAVRSRRSEPTRTPTINTGSPRRRTASPEYNATDCHVHLKWLSCLPPRMVFPVFAPGGHPVYPA